MNFTPFSSQGLKFRLLIGPVLAVVFFSVIALFYAQYYSAQHAGIAERERHASKASEIFLSMSTAMTENQRDLAVVLQSLSGVETEAEVFLLVRPLLDRVTETQALIKELDTLPGFPKENLEALRASFLRYRSGLSNGLLQLATDLENGQSSLEESDVRFAEFLALLMGMSQDRNRQISSEWGLFLEESEAYAVGLFLVTLVVFSTLLGATILSALSVSRELETITSKVQNLFSQQLPSELKTEVSQLNFAVTLAAQTHSDLLAVRDRLITSISELKVANEAKDKFLATMSHELRTPLNAILGYGQIMELDGSHELTERQTQYLNHIMTAGQHLLALISDILDLVELRAAQASLTVETVDVAAVLEDAAKAMKPLCESKDVKIVHGYARDRSFEIESDRTRVTQVLGSLISNAVKYNKPGGMVLLNVVIEADRCRIQVEDTGIGIPKEAHQSIFDLFVTVEDNPHLATEGMGMGLAITKLLVTRLNGSIDFESTLEKGSRFWVEFPTVFLK